MQISDVNSDHLLEIYPNPTADFINIKDMKAEFAGAQYFISDVSGKTLETSVLVSNKIDMQKHPKGLYIIILNAKSRIKTFKIIKN